MCPESAEFAERLVVDKTQQFFNSPLKDMYSNF